MYRRRAREPRRTRPRTRCAPAGARVRARLLRHRIDSQLAERWPPDATELHRIRARELSDPLTRHEVALALRRVTLDAEGPGVILSRAPVRRAAVLAWREGLLGLAEQLEGPAEVNPCGVARARLLITDGTGPLYSFLSGASVGDAVWRIADGLRLCPPHRWGCPVIAKRDPEHVTWTCGRCGLVATSSELEVRPA
jgi:hypothetical protein